MRILTLRNILITAIVLASGLTLNASSPAVVVDPPWIEVRSPRFRVISDGSETEARMIAREFEQIRAVFATMLPTLNLDAGPPLLILAPTDENSLKRLIPTLLGQNSNKYSGFFHHGWEKTFAVVRLDSIRADGKSNVASDAFSVIYHEYTHSLLHANFRWLPPWLHEGLAEFFGYTRFEPGKIYIGPVSNRLGFTKGEKLIPLDKFIVGHPASREFRDDKTVQIFYTQAWGLVHMLLLSPPKEEGKGLSAYLTKLEAGMDHKQAFQESIGDFKTLQPKLYDYINSWNLNSVVAPTPTQLDMARFVTRPMSSAEADIEIGLYQLRMGNVEAARTRITNGLKESADSGIAHEAMAFLNFAEGKDDDAALEFETAFRKDGGLYLSAYYAAMLSPKARSERREDMESIRLVLLRVLELKPTFAPAHIELAALDLRQGNGASALAHALKARELAPSRAGYHTFVGQILHSLGRDAEAASFARYVADRWTEVDHDEAVDLWETLPASVKTGTRLTKTPATNGARSLTGKIDATSCSAKGEMTVALNGGAPLVFDTAEGRYEGGFSDTVWYGGDHMSFCRHLEGLTAIIEYKPSSNSKKLPVLSKFHVRRPLSASAEPK